MKYLTPDKKDFSPIIPNNEIKKEINFEGRDNFLIKNTDNNKLVDKSEQFTVEQIINEYKTKLI